MDGRRRRVVKERFDLGIGFFGFFALAFFVITLVTEITGGNALTYSIITIGTAVIVALLWDLRRRVLAQADEPGPRP